MSKNHPLANQELTLDSYCAANHCLVSFSGRAHGLIDDELMKMGRERRILLTVNQFFTAGKIVAQSDLLTVLPRHFVNVTGFANQVVLRELPFHVAPIHVDALWHQRLQMARPHAWLREQVAALAEKAFGG